MNEQIAPRSCSIAVGVLGGTGAPVPQIAAARTERMRSLDPDIARVEREGIAAFDAVPGQKLIELGAGAETKQPAQFDPAEMPCRNSSSASPSSTRRSTSPPVPSRRARSAGMRTVISVKAAGVLSFIFSPYHVADWLASCSQRQFIVLSL